MRPDADDESTDSKACPYCGITFSLEGVDSYNSFINFHRHRPGPGRAPDPNSVAPPISTSYTFTAHHCPSCKAKIIWMNEVEETRVDDGYNSKVKSTSLL
jgi:predicted RNA-binding Zn-ribbon protein involved in translation (DUF1610 family)